MAKLAAGSGDGNDSSYEQALSDLADVVIKDRAPALQTYAVGFQLLDRDDDNNKAVGVKAFKVGKFWLFVPVFLINGRVKGTELLYIKNQDIFVPLQDDWVRYVMNKQAQEMGKGVTRNLSQLGVSVPDLRQIIRPPTKFAGDALAAAWEEGKRVFRSEVLPRWARAVTGRPLEKVSYALPDFVKEAGRPAVLALYRMVEDCPRLLADIREFHGDAVLKAAAEVARRPVAEPAKPVAELLDWCDPVKSGALQVYTYDQRLNSVGDLLDDFRPDEEGNDVRKGPLIKDRRSGDEVSIPYDLDATAALVNPDETGIYDVLTRPLEYERCLVVVKPRMLSGRWQAALVVRLSDKKYVAVHPTKVWAGRKYEDPEWSDFIEGLPEAHSIEERKDVDSGPMPLGAYDAKENRTRTIFIGPDHDATAPLYAYGAIGDADGGTVYKVNFDTRREDNGPDSYYATNMTTNQLRGDEYWCRSGMPGLLALGTSRGTKLWVAENTMYVPEGFKKLTVTHPEHEGGFLSLGSPYHATLGIVKKFPALKVAYARGEVRVNGRTFDEDGALVHLVAGHGLRADAAREVLKRAFDRRYKADGSYTCYVKYAGPYLFEQQPGAPPFPDPYMTEEPTLTGAVPAQPAQQFALPVTDMRPDPGALAGYDIRTPPPSLMQHVQDAAATGQKEVFDTSMIGSLLQSTQQDLQVDRFLGPLMTGLDAIARIMMALFWHDDDFAERYGKDDVVSLEDMLRNTFINLGKLILNLKQKGVEDPLDTQRDLELSTASEQ